MSAIDQRKDVYRISVEHLARALWEMPDSRYHSRPFSIQTIGEHPGIVDVSWMSFDELRELGGESGGPYGYLCMIARDLLKRGSR